MALQVYFYRPNQLMLTSYHDDQPDRFTWSLVECANIHYLFPKTVAQNLSELKHEKGAVFLPQIVRPMLAAMARPDYIQDVEAELKAMRRTKNAENDE